MPINLSVLKHCEDLDKGTAFRSGNTKFLGSKKSWRHRDSPLEEPCKLRRAHEAKDEAYEDKKVELVGGEAVDRGHEGRFLVT